MEQPTTEQRIRSIKAQIRSLRDALPYADHGTYGQDQRRISQLQGELARLLSSGQAEESR